MGTAPSIPDDIYHKWLDIALEDCPPPHYALLGLPIYETDVGKIERAASERTKIVRPRCLKHREIGTELLNQLAKARVCLTDSDRKSEYDAALRNR